MGSFKIKKILITSLCLIFRNDKMDNKANSEMHYLPGSFCPKKPFVYSYMQILETTMSNYF